MSELISVIVITYNSSNTIKDALESIKNQTYHNLELIVSDDGSHDNTLELCKEWLAINQDRFSKAIVITHKNTGTAANINRGLKIANGVWIRLLAGDDVLLPEAIETLYAYGQENPESSIVCGRVETIGTRKSHDDYGWTYNWKVANILETAEEQNWYLQKRNFIPCIGLLTKKEVFDAAGGYDEDIPLLEDWPMWIKMTAAGYKIHFINKVVAQYRLSDNGVSGQSNYRFAYSIILFKYKYIYKQMRKFRMIQKLKFLKRKSILSSLVYRYIAYDSLKYVKPW